MITLPEIYISNKSDDELIEEIYIFKLQPTAIKINISLIFYTKQTRETTDDPFVLSKLWLKSHLPNTDKQPEISEIIEGLALQAVIKIMDFTLN